MKSAAGSLFVRQRHFVEQNTPELLAARKTCLITASEFGDVLFSPDTLYDRKTGEKQFEGNYYTSRGHEMKPVIRDWVNELMPEQKYLQGGFYTMTIPGGVTVGASPDAVGVNTLLEIKCKFQTHRKGKVKLSVDEKHWAQMAGQALICDYANVLYSRWDEMDPDMLFLSWFTIKDQIALFERVFRPAILSFAHSVATKVKPAKVQLNQKLLIKGAMMKYIKTDYL